MLQLEIASAEPLSILRMNVEPESAAGLGRILRFRQQVGELAWVVGGKLTAVGANAVLVLLLAGRLELNLYGLFVTSIGGQLLLSRLLMLGVDRGVIRLHTLSELQGQTRDLYTAGLTVILRMSALLILTAITLILALKFSASPAGQRWPGWMISSIVAGAVGTALVDYGNSVYLSEVRYRAAALWQGGAALGRFVATVVAVLLLPHRPAVIFLAYFSTSLAAGLLLSALIPGSRDKRCGRGLVNRLLSYSLWQGGTNFITLLYIYQGTFLLTWLGREAAAGIFGLGVMLSMGFHAVYIAYADYLLPRISRVESLNALPSFLVHAFGVAMALAIGSIPIAVAVGTIVAGIVSPEVRDVTPVFYCLSASMLLLVCFCPLDAICHYLLRPQLVTFGWALRVVCVSSLTLVLAPNGGAWGAAIGQLGGTAIGLTAFAVCVAVVLRAARKAAI
jgi:O-antigen/teichoic acid export membrane protein